MRCHTPTELRRLVSAGELQESAARHFLLEWVKRQPYPELYQANVRNPWTSRTHSALTRIGRELTAKPSLEEAIVHAERASRTLQTMAHLARLTPDSSLRYTPRRGVHCSECTRMASCRHTAATLPLHAADGHGDVLAVIVESKEE